MYMLKSYINLFSLKALHAQAEQSSSAFCFAYSSFHLVYRLEPLLGRLQRKNSHTKRKAP